MTSSATCTRCGAQLDMDASVGICRKCLSLKSIDETLDYASLPKMSLSLSQANLPSSPKFIATTEFLPSPRPNTPPAMLPEVGQRLGQYQLLRLLGKGGMGCVYEAEHVEHHRRLALKVLNQRLESEEYRIRFLREGRLAAALNHPNSVYIFGSDEIGGTPVIAMELVQGGTLQDRVQRDGPLPIGEAVDVILQLVAGLQAAETAGVLHRDVKPSNCFVGLDGTVKIGDFGLSISKSPEVTNITQDGVFLGTPAFSSPEQLQGQELDARSDIYSLGVTLYYLLTGRTPFEHHQLVQLLATVLQQPAPSPASVRSDIPNGLAQVVLRCLAKRRIQRFKSYDDLRNALLPYSSQAPTPATLPLRVLAYSIDEFICYSIALILVLLWYRDWEIIFNPLWFVGYKTPDMHTKFLAQAAMGFVVWAVYFTVSEGVWGATIGKAICRLRTIGLNGRPPELLRAVLRATIFQIENLLHWLYFAYEQLIRAGNYDSENEWLFLLTAVSLLLFVTMRKRNGYAGLHEVVSGTRVVGERTFSHRPVLEGEKLSDSEVPPPKTDGPVTDSKYIAFSDVIRQESVECIGPYQLLQSQDQTTTEQTLLGYDDRLRRKVWIRRLLVASPQPRREISRIGRLRWLNGEHNSNDNREAGWDAYEAPSGKPLLAIISKPQSWDSVRFWLSDLAHELDACRKDNTFPDTLDLDRVWITADGRAKILDFRAPWIDQQSSKLVSQSRDESNVGVSFEPLPSQESLQFRAGIFLRQVAIAALQGKVLMADQASSHDVAVLLPLSAHKLLNELGRYDDSALPTAELDMLTQQPANITTIKRAGVLAACWLPIMLFCLAGALVLWYEKSGKKDLLARFPEAGELFALVELYESLEEKDPKIPSLEIVVVQRFRQTINNKDFWSHDATKTVIDAANREWLQSLPAKHPEVTEKQALEAAIQFGLPQHFPPARDSVKDFVAFFGFLSFFVALYVVFIVLPASWLSIMIVGNSLLLRAFNIEVVTSEGKRASRLRILRRSMLLWSLVLCLLVSISVCILLIYSEIRWLAIVAIPVFIFLLTRLFLAERPFHDRLVGTRLVPG